jgi:hypothetical protein
MIPISEKSSGGPLVDWVRDGHGRKYTEPRSDVDPDRRDSVGLAYIDARGPPRIGSFSSSLSRPGPPNGDFLCHTRLYPSLVYPNIQIICREPVFKLRPELLAFVKQCMDQLEGYFVDRGDLY